ncbi:MAG: protein BatD, partial [Bacteroidota bacterium]
QNLDAGRTTEFYEAVFHALYGFLSDKLNIPVSDLSKERISEVLHQRAIEDAVINQLMATLDRCEMARFAPSSDVTGQEVFDQAATIISQLQQALK